METSKLTERVSRSGRARVAFGDVAELSGERSASPSGDGYQRYVGLEHIDPGNLTIRRWGQVADGTTFSTVFHAGQTLFGKRRAYQRKVAVAGFDGVCSGDIYVLKPKGPSLLPELLPFICQTEEFLEYAVGTSAGSLSPRTNWTSLAGFEFDLPALAEQQRIAELLSRVDALTESLVATRERAQNLRAAHLAEFFRPRSGLMKRLSEVARIVSGSTPSKSNAAFWGGQHPWATAKDLKRRDIADTEDKLTEEGWREATVVPAGATLVVVRGMILAHTFPVASCRRQIAINQDLKALVATEEIEPDYLLLWAECMAPAFLGRTAQSTHGTKRLETDVLASAAIPVPSRAKQLDLVMQQTKLVRIVESAKERISMTAAVKSMVLRHVFKE